MLVNPTFINAEYNKNVSFVLAEIAPGKNKVQAGVLIINHWSIDRMVKEKVAIYPKFSKEGLEFFQSIVAKDGPDYKVSSYDREQLASYECVPDEDFHHYDAWAKLPKENIQDFVFEEGSRPLSNYGVCDSPDQLLTLYDFEKDPRKLFISMVRLDKKHEPMDGGWRWHKWGNFIGLQIPTAEYLAHEPVIETVYTYHIYHIL